MQVLTTDTNPGQAQFIDAALVSTEALLVPQGILQPSVAAALGASTMGGSGLLAGFAQVQNNLTAQILPPGVAINQSTSAVANNQAYMHMPTSASLFSINTGRVYLSELFLLSSTTNIRLFIGFASNVTGAPGASDDPAFGHLGLQFSTSRGDTTFQIARRVAAQTLTDTGVIPTGSTLYRFEIIGEATSVRVRLWNFGFVGVTPSATLVYDEVFTTNLPPTGTYFSGLQTLVATLKTHGRLRTSILVRSGALL